MKKICTWELGECCDQLFPKCKKSRLEVLLKVKGSLETGLIPDPPKFPRLQNP